MRVSTWSHGSVMRRLCQSASSESGAVATLVAILMGGGVLLGMGALTIDVGQIYAERAELQNGADAAALAVAQDCVDGSCDTSTSGLADALADQNARKDGAARVTTVCGVGPLVPACAPNAGPTLTQCIGTVPAGATGWIEARTATQELGGGSLLPPSFARALTNNSGYSGTEVGACGRAAWGPPGSAAMALAVTISLCEWLSMTNNGATFPSAERALYLHDTTGATNCPAGPSGADLPGGFGWLDGAACSATIDASGWVVDGAQPGNGVSPDCKASLEANLGKTLFIPIFIETNGLNGNNGNYLIDGFAAFKLTGYRLPGVGQVSILTGTHLCTASQKCLYGQFVEALVPTATFGPGGSTYRGANAVALIG